jgi:3-phenylpropionate/trans-cinnamate dioxygenase ferredoxin component
MSRRIEVPPANLPGVGARSLLHVEGLSIALFNVEGAIYAIDDACPHAGSSLLGGVLSGRTVQCRAHGLRFDLVTGCMPGVANFGVRSYPVEVCDGRTFLTIPESCTPDAPGM